VNSMVSPETLISKYKTRIYATTDCLHPCSLVEME